MVNKNNNEPRTNIDTRSINEEEAVYVDGYDRIRLLENSIQQERQITTKPPTSEQKEPEIIQPQVRQEPT